MNREQNLNNKDKVLHAGGGLNWVSVGDEKPKDCEAIIGIEMPCEAIYACHREDDLYISDETGDNVVLTHWIYIPNPPRC